MNDLWVSFVWFLGYEGSNANAWIEPDKIIDSTLAILKCWYDIKQAECWRLMQGVNSFGDGKSWGKNTKTMKQGRDWAYLKESHVEEVYGLTRTIYITSLNWTRQNHWFDKRLFEVYIRLQTSRMLTVDATPVPIHCEQISNQHNWNALEAEQNTGVAT